MAAGADKLKPRPLVSVVLAACNHEPFIAEAVQSVLAQSFEDLELIVFDDASTDRTPDIVEAIKDDRLQLIRSPANRLQHGRNVALARCSGKYVAFQNSDDVWRKDKLFKQVSLLEARPELAACFSAVEIIGPDTRPAPGTFFEGMFSTENLAPEQWLQRFFELGNCLCITSAVVRADLLSGLGGFCESLVQLGDLDLWVRLAALGEFLVLDEQLTAMRFTSGQNLSRLEPPVLRRIMREYVRVLLRYAEAPLVDQLARVFPWIVAQDMTRLERTVALALDSALRSPMHALFAERVLEQALDNPADRTLVCARFGTRIVHDFLHLRTRIETVLHASPDVDLLCDCKR